jgi:hypothetical protein
MVMKLKYSTPSALHGLAAVHPKGFGILVF